MQATRAVLAALLLLVLATPVRGNLALEGAISAAFYPHTHSDAMQAIAEARAQEIVTDFSHNGQRSGTGEVLAWYSGLDVDPVAWATDAWWNSPVHHELLMNRELSQIGCAHLEIGLAHYFACVVTWGESPVAPEPAPYVPPTPEPGPTPAPSPQPVVLVLPDTALGQ